MDTGSNRPLLQMNVESIAEVKVLTSELSGRVRPVERPADHAPSPRAAPTGSAARSTTSSAIPTGTPTARPTSSTAIRRPIAEGARLGLLDRRPDRQAGRQQQAVLLLQPGVRAAHAAATTSCASACRRRSSGRATSRRRPTTTANLYPYIKDPQLDRRVLGDRPDGLLRRRRRARQDSRRTGSIRPGLNILKLYPLPNIANVPGVSLQLRDHPADRERPRVAAGGPRRLSADRRRCARRSSTPAGSSADQTFNGTIPGFNDTQMQHAPVVELLATSVNYTLNPTTFLEATYGHSQNELAGCALAQTRHRADRSARAAIPMNADRRIGNNAGLGEPAAAVPGREHAQPELLRRRGAEQMSPTPPFWSTARCMQAADVRVGQPRRQRAAEHRRSRASSTSTRRKDFSISLTKVTGRHTVKTGFYNTHSYKAEQTQQQRVRHASTSAGHGRHQPLDTSFGFANAAIGTLQLVPRRRRSTSRAAPSTTTPRPTSRTTGR